MNNTNIETVDFVAIGLGPFNLGLACLSEPIDEVKGVFLEKQEKFDWHPGMLLEDTTLQIPFMADLVTLADPTSPYSFLNYIKASGRIYSFYIRENFLLFRNEYNQYCQWVISKLKSIYFNTEVIAIDYLEEDKLYIVSAKSTKTDKLQVYRTAKLVLGTGTEPHIPTCAKEVKQEVSHTSNYLMSKAQIQQKKAITVVGSGQSAAEVFYDLLQEIETHNYQLNWITRSPRFFPLEYSKLTLEMTSPEYVDYFFNLPSEKRDYLISNQKHLYKGINQDLIGSIFDLLYAKRLTNDVRVQLRTNSTLRQIQKLESGQFELIFHQHEQNKHYRHITEEVVMATGYKSKQPSFIDGIKNRVLWDAKGRYNVNRNYSIDTNGNQIFVQNAELHTHGFVTPDLGMGAYRNSFILKEITGKDHYPIEEKIAFQQFDVSADEEVCFDGTRTLVN